MKKITLTMIVLISIIGNVFSQTGNCLHFDGVNDNVRRAVISVNNTSVSVGIRVNPTGTLSTNQYLFYNGTSTSNGFGMMIPSGSTSVNIIYGGLSTIATGFTLTPNNWTLLSLTISNNQLRFFVNGTQSFSATTASTPNAASTGSFSIGSDDAGGQNFLGLMEEFRFWNRTICPAAVAFRASCQLNASEPGLVVYYPFNQGIASASNSTVTSLLDVTSNALHATLNNFALTGTTSNWLSTTGALTTFCGIAPPNATIVPSTSAICNGGSVTFSVTGINTFTWSNNATTATIAASPSVTTSYSVIGLDNTSGCIYMAINTTVVNPNPTVSVIASNASVCPSINATLTASGASTYSWSNSSTGTSVVVNPSLTTTYSIIGTNSFGCSNSASIGITVFPSPTINISASNASVCPNGSVSLTASGAATYSWSSSSTSTSIIVNPSINTTYSVTGTNTFGCQRTATTSLFVFPSPTITLASINGSICPGNSTSITASGALTYTWNTSSNNTIVSVSPTITTNYSVAGTNTFGCQNSASIGITVFPVPQLSVSSSNSFLCQGSAATLIATGANTYTWSNANTSASVTVSPSVTTTYSVIGSNTQGCFSTRTIALTVNANTLTVSAPTIICQGSTYTLNASGANTYTWNGTFTLSSYPVTATTAAVYTVVAKDANNCILNATTSIGVNALPSITFTISRNSICTKESASITASGANTYSWSTGSSSAQIVVSPTTSAASTVYSYSVTGTNTNNCSATAVQSLTVNLCTGLEMTNSNFIEVKIFPNPNNGRFVIEMLADAELIMINQLGEKILSKHLEQGSNEIDLSAFNTGIYFVQLKQADLTKTVRIIKN